MKDAETRDIGEVGDGDVFSEMLLDVGEKAPQSCVIQSMPRLHRRTDESSLGVCVHQPGSAQSAPPLKLIAAGVCSLYLVTKPNRQESTSISGKPHPENHKERGADHVRGLS